MNRQIVFIFLALFLFITLLPGCSDLDDDDDDSGDDDTGDDDTGDDDDDSPPLPQIEVFNDLNWGKCVCGELPEGTVSITTGNYNIYGGKDGSANDIGLGLKAYGPLDFFTLQEATLEYTQTIAEVLQMEFYFNGGQAILSRTPLVDPSFILLETWRRVLHATSIVDGVSFSVYSAHIDWDADGDRDAQQIVREVLADDPAERILIMGDWNDEHGSTQVNFLNEILADAWSSLGVNTSARVTWPSIGFYGTEGQQLIDNTYFNKASGACATSGEIINFTPTLSDHKPEIVTVAFPPVAQPAPPILLDVVYGLGEGSIGLLFDKPLQSVQVQVNVDGTEATVTDVFILGDGTLVRADLAETPAPYTDVIVTVTEAVDIDGVALSQEAELSFSYLPNLLTDGGAENLGDGWNLDGVATSVGQYHVEPLDGSLMFSGIGGTERGWARQDVSLNAYRTDIDDGRAWIAFSGASTTGYRRVEDGQSNLLLPHDECEALVYLYDKDGKIVSTLSSGRYDTLYWHPWRAVGKVPPGTRSAQVVLRSVGVEQPHVFNSASHDAIHFSLFASTELHGLLGRNLVEDPHFIEDPSPWLMDRLVIVREDNWFPLIPDLNVKSYSGENVIVALFPFAGRKQIRQVMDLREYLEDDVLSLHWGGAMRNTMGFIDFGLTLSFIDSLGNEFGHQTISPEPVSEWFMYQEVTPVPAEAKEAVMTWHSEAADEQGIGTFFNVPFVYPVQATGE